MTTSVPHRLWIAWLAALSLLLQVAIPRGFMPAELSTGWYLQLCPQGLSAGAAAAFLGEDAHHHHQHLHQHQHQHEQQSKAADTEPQRANMCELAGQVADEAAILPWSSVSFTSLVQATLQLAPVSYNERPRPHYISRAPPSVW
ncbi:MAG: hypothetical protein AAGI11_09440 [Pseudomonadota bacterium]